MDKALQHFRDIMRDLDKFLDQHYNEADTRVKFIDPLLTKVLGWDENKHIRREERHTEDQARRCIDYRVSLLEPVLVVEAKKCMVDFEIPTTTRKIKYKLNGVIKESWPRAWKAIQQAHEYCDLPEVGARYALVTNGRQYIAFKALSERSWTDSNALCFCSPERLLENFTLFYECLSRETIASEKLTEIATERPPVVSRTKARSSLGPILGGHRNEMYGVCHQAFSAVLLDVPGPSEEFIRQCFCTSDDVQKYGQQIGAVLADPLPLFRKPIKAVRPGHRKDGFDQTFRGGLISVSNTPLFVLMGGPGVGKTIFLKWYFQEQIPKTGRDSTIIVYCDFREVVCELDELHALTLRMVIDTLSEVGQEYLSDFTQLREVFGAKIDKELRGVLKPYAEDPAERNKRISDIIQTARDYSPGHLATIIRYLRDKCQKQTIIILDNMDQKLPPLQNKLYQIAHELVFSCEAITLIALRELTFRRLLGSPEANAFSTVDFHIKAATLSAVLEKRIAFLSSRLSSEKEPIQASAGVHFEVQDFDRFLNLLRRSLLSEQADEQILECLAAVSNGNLRQQLKMLYTFLISGQTKLKDYFWTYAIDTSKRIPFHEVLHSLVYEDRRVYEELEGHLFMNIFEPGPSLRASHFTALRILAYFRTGLGQNGDLRQGDYVTIDQIGAEFDSLGVNGEEIEWHVQRLALYGLLLPEEQEPKSLLSTDRVALTRCGVYYVEKLYKTFAYYSAMAGDAGIYDEPVVTVCSDLLKSAHLSVKIPLETRRKIADYFIKYLKTQERRELRGSLAKHPLFGAIEFVPPMQKTQDEVSRHILAAEQKRREFGGRIT